MRLYLIRHGEYVDASMDPEKPLSPSGKEKIRRIGKFLKAEGVQVNRFFHGTKKRAEQTAYIIRDIINTGAPIESKDYLAPNDSPKNIIYDISFLNENVLIAGHLPFLPVLIAELLNKNIQESPLHKMPVGSVVALERANDHLWSLVFILDPDSIF